MPQAYDAYDRVKAHEYYLRTRKLKGRKKASPKPPLSSIRPGSHAQGGLGKKASKASKTPAQLRSETQAKVAGIKARIAKLEAALKALLKESDSSKKKTPEKKTGTKSASSSDAKPLTAAQKAEKKKANADYYDKHKKPAEKSTGTHEMTNEQKIEEVRKQLKAARAQLRAAMSRAGHPTKPANGMKGR